MSWRHSPWCVVPQPGQVIATLRWFVRTIQGNKMDSSVSRLVIWSSFSVMVRTSFGLATRIFDMFIISSLAEMKLILSSSFNNTKKHLFLRSGDGFCPLIHLVSCWLTWTDGIIDTWGADLYLQTSQLWWGKLISYYWRYLPDWDDDTSFFSRVLKLEELSRVQEECVHVKVWFCDKFL